MKLWAKQCEVWTLWRETRATITKERKDRTILYKSNNEWIMKLWAKQCEVWTKPLMVLNFIIHKAVHNILLGWRNPTDPFQNLWLRIFFSSLLMTFFFLTLAYRLPTENFKICESTSFITWFYCMIHFSLGDTKVLKLLRKRIWARIDHHFLCRPWFRAKSGFQCFDGRMINNKIGCRSF